MGCNGWTMPDFDFVLDKTIDDFSNDDTEDWYIYGATWGDHANGLPFYEAARELRSRQHERPQFFPFLRRRKLPRLRNGERTALRARRLESYPTATKGFAFGTAQVPILLAPPICRISKILLARTVCRIWKILSARTVCRISKILPAPTAYGNSKTCSTSRTTRWNC